SCSPPCPLTRLIVMPVTPARNSAAFTCGSRSGRTTALMSFIPVLPGDGPPECPLSASRRGGQGVRLYRFRLGFELPGPKRHGGPRPPPATPFHPSPYGPSAKSPSERIPHSPLTPWTEIAPTGSSMRSRASMKNTATHTSTPATPPINTADGAVTNAHGAVMATSPASVPFATIEGSGLPYLTHM